MTSHRLDHGDMAHENETLHEVVKFLFGDGAYETFEKAGPDSSELHVHGAAAASKKKARNDEVKRKIGFATNAAGAVAGPAALWQANKARKEGKGGVPRDLARAVGGSKALKNTKVGRGTLKAVKWLDSPGSKPAKVAAGVAGASMVGLQAANWVGDSIAAQSLAAQKKKKDAIDKALPEVPGDPRKKLVDQKKQGMSLGAPGQLVRLAANEGPKAVGGTKAVAAQTQTGIRALKAKKQDVAKHFMGVADDMTVTSEISKVDTDKRQVFGWASVVERNGEPVVDLQGDYISVEEVEKAAYEYVQKSRKGGNMHKRNGEDPHHVSDMIESFVLTPEKKEKLGIPESTPTGWWVGYQVHDDETWDQIKSGKRPAFSIHGRGKRVEL